MRTQYLSMLGTAPIAYSSDPLPPDAVDTTLAKGTYGGPLVGEIQWLTVLLLGVIGLLTWHHLELTDRLLAQKTDPNLNPIESQYATLTPLTEGENLSGGSHEAR